MPELPEVETTKSGIAPHLEGKQIKEIRVFEPRLRWPIPSDLATLAQGATIVSIERRAKYLLFHTSAGTVIGHLGMSGSMRIADLNSPRRKHDHVELEMADGTLLRYHDPRRFGAILWAGDNWAEHPTILALGPEPFDELFTGEYLFQATRKRSIPIKTLIMTNAIVVGVGNIYANEALFMAGVRPKRAAKRVTRAEAYRLRDAIVDVLTKAITQGGTTLKDFVNSDGQPGYFAQQLMVYGRDGEPCITCGEVLKLVVIAGRASVYCPSCQR